MLDSEVIKAMRGTPMPEPYDFKGLGTAAERSEEINKLLISQSILLKLMLDKECELMAKVFPGKSADEHRKEIIAERDKLLKAELEEIDKESE